MVLYILQYNMPFIYRRQRETFHILYIIRTLSMRTYYDVILVRGQVNHVLLMFSANIYFNGKCLYLCVYAVCKIYAQHTDIQYCIVRYNILSGTAALLCRPC